MEEKTISSLELKVTYIHDKSNENLKKTWKWLDEILQKGEMDKILSPVATTIINSRVDVFGRRYYAKEKESLVTAVRDPDTHDLFVYDGNKRVAHAIQNKYNIKISRNEI